MFELGFFLHLISNITFHLRESKWESSPHSVAYKKNCMVLFIYSLPTAAGGGGDAADRPGWNDSDKQC